MLRRSLFSSFAVYKSTATAALSCSRRFAATTSAAAATTLELDGESLTTAALWAANSDAVKVSVAERKWEGIAKARMWVDDICESERMMVYGLNSSCGGMANRLLPKDEIPDFQLNLIRCVATQVGDRLSDADVRRAMVARINALCRGFSGIAPENLRVLIDMVNKGVYPVVPQQGSLGASGDLGPLACIALAAAGEHKCCYQGKVLPSAEALAQAGITPMKLRAKEALSLINGTSVMASVASECVERGKNLVLTQDVTAALSFEALLAYRDQFNPMAHARAKPHSGQFATATNISRLMATSRLTLDDKAVSHDDAEQLAQKRGTTLSIPIENAYSIRAYPQCAGPQREAIRFAQKIIETELNSTNDNPVIFEELGDAGFFQMAQFHGQYMSLASDTMATALINVCVMADKRIDRMLSEFHSSGLPTFLSGGCTGKNMALMGVQFVSASLAAEARTLAIPASIQSISTTDTFQDVVSFGLIAARKARTVIDLGEKALAAELLCNAQAVELRGLDFVSKPGRALHAAVRETVPFQGGGNIDQMPALAELTERVRSGELLRRVADAMDDGEKKLLWIDDEELKREIAKHKK